MNSFSTKSLKLENLLENACQLRTFLQNCLFQLDCVFFPAKTRKVSKLPKLESLMKERFFEKLFRPPKKASLTRVVSRKMHVVVGCLVFLFVVFVKSVSFNGHHERNDDRWFTITGELTGKEILLLTQKVHKKLMYLNITLIFW